MATKDVEMKDAAAAPQADAEKKAEQPVDPIAVLLSGMLRLALICLHWRSNSLVLLPPFGIPLKTSKLSFWALLSYFDTQSCRQVVSYNFSYQIFNAILEKCVRLARLRSSVTFSALSE
jgi:hypothetical protein